MYLKNLELLGFKTFADKTELRFPDGITSIVGPNGSGKSNISDALRWVLGEQSLKDLRSSNLQEVIFNGSQGRKPLGLAQVTLTIDNSDNVLPVEFSEVSIARCVYRSGESEFYINKTPCRLKDIHDLFLGTGLGRDTYSIVGQGQVDLVLSSKPEDRRLLFEEAAGISRIKYRKKEALRKCDAASQNLARVQDILTEVESHLEPLRRQAEKAKRYFEIKDQYKTLDLSLKSIQLKRLEETALALHEKINTQQESIQRLKDSIVNFENEKANLLLEQEHVEKDIQSQRDKLSECASRKNHISEELAVLRERTKSVESNRIYLHDEISRHEAKDALLTREQDELSRRKILYEDELKCIEENIAAAEKERETLKEKIQQENLSLDERKKELIEILRRLALCHNEKIFCEKLLNERETEDQSLFREEEQILLKQNNISEKRLQASYTLQTLSAQEMNLLRFSEALQAVSQEVRQNVSRLEDECRRTDSFLFAKQSELSVYENFIHHRSNESMAEEVRQVFSDFGRTLFSSIKVREGYERAIEAALGSRLESFIVRDTETAKKILLFLKEKESGRIQLAVLDRIKPHRESALLPPSVLEKEGVCGPALNFISFEDESLSEFLVYLLDSVVVAENIHAAFSLLSGRDLPAQISITTLDGDGLSSNGLFEGGSRHKESWLEIERFRRETVKNIDELKLKKTQLDEKFHFASCVLESLNEDYANIQSALKGKRDEKIRCETESMTLIEKERGINRELEIVKAQLASCREDKKYQDNQYRALEEKIHVYENQKNFLESDVNAKEIKLAEIKAQDDEKMRHIMQKNMDRIKLQEQISSSVETLKSFAEQIKTLREDKENCRVRIQECANLSGELQDAGKNMESQFAAISEKNIHYEDELSKLLEKRGLAVSLIADKDTQIKKLWEESELQNEALKQLEIARARCGLAIDEIERLLNEEYGMVKDSLPVEGLIEIGNEEEAQAKLLKWRNSLRNIGSVNTEAEREFEEIKERHIFLSTQKQDIEASIEKLKETIRELDTEARALFLKTFYEIEKHFAEIFAQLFGGGDAKLILLEGEDIFDVGVDLKIQLPGKALQPISLLSGGEKSLVAVALLFAILAVNPSPFCVLDEIDAALDESNVGRFAELLRKFSKRTQFIVITHNKGTMKSADVLYGVTMEEPGVSRLISLKLGDVREEMLVE